MAEKKTRIQMDAGPQTMAILKRLQEAHPGRSRAETIKAGLKLLDLVTDPDCQVLKVDHDGTRRELVVI